MPQRQLLLSQTRDGQLQVLRRTGDDDVNEEMFENGDDEEGIGNNNAEMPIFFRGI